MMRFAARKRLMFRWFRNEHASTKLNAFVLFVSVAILALMLATSKACDPPAGTVGCWYTYGGLTAKEFKQQADALGRDIQQPLNKFKDANNPNWPATAQCKVYVGKYNNAVIDYLCCIYDRDRWYVAWRGSDASGAYIQVKGVKLP